VEVTSSVWTIVRELDRAGRVQRRVAARAPFGPVGIGLLDLAAQAPVTPKAAATALDVPAQSVTRATAELAAAGLVRRVGDRADGRSYTLELTAEGRAAAQRFRDELATRFARHLDGWSETEITTFAQQLSALVTSIAADVEPSAPHSPNPWRT
jgi:DNA-binding MarR family transcriptional regulator